jgi:hypothetical protein
MEVITGIEQGWFTIVRDSGQYPLTIGALILLLVVAALLLFVGFLILKWARRVFEEQERLKVLFEDQMFLLGNFNKELIKLKGILQGERDSVPSRDSISSTAQANVSAQTDTSVRKESASVLGEEDLGNRRDSQLILKGRTQMEGRLRALARESGIEIEGFHWDRKPGHVKSRFPYILTMSGGGKSSRADFSEQELRSFSRSAIKDAGQKLAGIANDLKQKIRASNEDAPAASRPRNERS